MPYKIKAYFGRGDGVRTHDLSVPNAARYQLRYASNRTEVHIVLMWTSYG